MVGIKWVESGFVYVQSVVAIELNEILDAVLIGELDIFLYY
jgi:hypothetical protein